MGDALPTLTPHSGFQTLPRPRACISHGLVVSMRLLPLSQASALHVTCCLWPTHTLCRACFLPLQASEGWSAPPLSWGPSPLAGLWTRLQQVPVAPCCQRAFFLCSWAGLPPGGASQQCSSATSSGQASSGGFRRREDLRPTCLSSEEPPDPRLGPQMLPLNLKLGSRQTPAPSCGTHKHVVLATNCPPFREAPRRD